MARELAIEVKENGMIRRRRILMLGEWLFDSKDFHAWFTLRKIYCMISGRAGLVVDERYALPLSPYLKERYTQEEIELRTDRKRRIQQAFNFMKNKSIQESHTNVISWTIALIVSSSVLVFLIMALLLASGKIQI